MDPKASPAPHAPRVVGRYSLVSRVVSGALGDLYRAKIASGAEAGRVVLVRLVERTAAMDTHAVERLTNAGFAAMELRDAKIAAVLDVAVADTEIAVVSEHVGGAVLHALMKQTGPKRAPATPPLALRVARDTLEALDAVREPWSEITTDPQTDDEKAIATGIFGGLTPDCLLVATFGETMLLETGLSGTAMTVPAVADHPDVVSYRAPEQLEPKGPVDERADLFTVGVIAWELIAGRSLFGPMFVPKPQAASAPGKPKTGAEAAAVAATRRKVLTAAIQRLDSMPLLKGKVTTEAASWVARCVERDPAARFPTLRDAIQELDALGPNAIAPADAVSKWLLATGIELDLKTEIVEEPIHPSNRPTPPPETRRGAEGEKHEPPSTPLVVTPPSPSIQFKGETPPAPEAQEPESEAAVTPSFDTTTVKVAAPPAEETAPASAEAITIPPSADVESIPPSAESIPPSTDIESIPPSTDIESIPPSAEPMSASVESVPPSSEDAVTLPPGRPAVAPAVPMPFALPAQVKTAAFPIVGSPAPVPDAEGAAGSEAASAPARRDSRKVVVYVMAGAGLLAVLGLIRVMTSRGSADVEKEGARSAASAAVMEPAPSRTPEPPPSKPPAPVATELPAPAASAGPAAEAPTSAPSAGAPGEAPDMGSLEAAVRRANAAAASKKKTFRPTGI